ncbi:MAG: DUF4097 family beta strand repeat-containing protein [Gammaproteobacteria bacterium]
MSARTQFFATIVAFLASLAAADVHAEDISRSFDVQPGGELEIDTDVGSIDIVTADVNTVTIDVRLRGQDAEEFNLEFSQSKDGVRLRGRAESRFMNHHHRDLSVRIQATIPKQFNLNLDTAGGSIDIADLDGRVKADTSGGSIDLGVISGKVRVSTSGGSIEIEEGGEDVLADTSGGSITIGKAAGRIDADTSGGSIRIGRGDGAIKADTAGGSITIKESFAAVDASTAGGGVRVGFAGQPKRNSRLSTSGGTVTVYLADGLSFDIDARSGNGVSNDLDLDNASAEPGRLDGKLNGGGPELELRSSGRIRIKRL